MGNKKTSLKTAIENELSGDKALQNAAYISQFLRAPGSKGLHTVLNFIEEKLIQNNLDKIEKIKYRFFFMASSFLSLYSMVMPETSHCE